MSKIDLKEKMFHGTPDFPMAMYSYGVQKENCILVSLNYHKEFEFCIAVCGEIEVQINEAKLILKKGEGVFINSRAFHLVTSLYRGENVFIAAVFDSALICTDGDIINRKYIAPLAGAEKTHERISDKETELILKSFEDFKEKAWGYEIRLKNNITELMTKRIENTRLSYTDKDRKKEVIKKVIDYIHKNYEEEITLAELAECAYVSKGYLCRLFSKTTGVSPIEHLNRYRIMKSAAMLAESGWQVSDISGRCGFNNSSYFNKLFMRYMGCTPSEYRKNNSM